MKGEKIMAKTYAAFYLPPEEKEVKLPDQKNVDRIKSSVSRALRNAKQSVLNFDINSIAAIWICNQVRNLYSVMQQAH